MYNLRKNDIDTSKKEEENEIRIRKVKPTAGNNISIGSNLLLTYFQGKITR